MNQPQTQPQQQQRRPQHNRGRAPNAPAAQPDGSSLPHLPMAGNARAHQPPQPPRAKGFVRFVEQMEGRYLSFKELNYGITNGSYNPQLAERILNLVRQTQIVLPAVLGDELGTLASMRFRVEKYIGDLVAVYCHAAYLREDQSRVGACILLGLGNNQYIRRVSRISYTIDPRDLGTDEWVPSRSVEKLADHQAKQGRGMRSPAAHIDDASFQRGVSAVAAADASAPSTSTGASTAAAKATARARLSKLLSAFKLGEPVFYSSDATNWTLYTPEHYKLGLKLNAEGYTWMLNSEMNPAPIPEVDPYIFAQTLTASLQLDSSNAAKSLIFSADGSSEAASILSVKSFDGSAPEDLQPAPEGTFNTVGPDLGDLVAQRVRQELESAAADLSIKELSESLHSPVMDAELEQMSQTVEVAADLSDRDRADAEEALVTGDTQGV